MAEAKWARLVSILPALMALALAGAAVFLSAVQFGLESPGDTDTVRVIILAVFFLVPVGVLITGYLLAVPRLERSLNRRASRRRMRSSRSR